MISTIRKSQYPTSVTCISKPAVIALAATVLLMAGSLMAQELSGRIAGTVTDEQGAFMPGAEVTATHVATNYVYRAVTSDTGRFTLPKVRLGRYTVAAEMPGFRRAVVQDAIVEVGGTATLRITLQVGEIQEEITVTAETTQELVNTVDTELGAVVDERRVLELPLDGRNAIELTFLQAGVYFDRDDRGRGQNLFVHGQRDSTVNITLNGVDVLDQISRFMTVKVDFPMLALAAENVQEFRVITGIGSAETSRGGVQISAVTRAGTNDWHGSIFEFHRNTVLNANEFFNNARGVERFPLIRNQFGGRVGGPIWRDKTFFFFGYQQWRQSRGIPVLRRVYTAQARQGVFRYDDGGVTRTVNLLDCGATAQAVLGRDCVDDRFNLSSPIVSGGAVTPDPFIAGDIFGLVPLPNNFDTGDGLNTGGFRFNAVSRLFEHVPSFRIDHNINEKHSFSGTVNYMDREIVGDFINDRHPRFPDSGTLGNRITHSRGFSAALTSIFTPTLINEFRFGSLNGENRFQVIQPFDTPFVLDFNIEHPDSDRFIYDHNNQPEGRTTETYHLRDVVSWVRGNHQLKFGAEWRHRWVNFWGFDGINAFGEIDLDDGENTPGFSSGDLGKLAGGGKPSSTERNRARELMNDLVGAIGEVEVRYNVTSLTSGFVPGVEERRILQNRELDIFFNDAWQLIPNLTLNLGLRWEYATVPYETRGIILVPEGGQNAVFGVSGPEGFFNPGTLAGSPCSILGTLPLGRTSSNARSLITSCATRNVPGSSSNGVPLFKDDLDNFGPVIGLAWDPWGDGKTAVRAGFRITYVQDPLGIIERNLDDNEGLVIDEDCIPLDGNCQNNPTLLRNVLAGGTTAPAVPEFRLPAVRTILNSSSQDFRTYATNLATSYYNEWTFGLQREVLPNLALEARYVGQRGVKLRRMANFSEINIFAFDPVTNMSFLDSFIIAQQNLACNTSQGLSKFGFSDASGAPCITPNPLMAALIAGDPGRLDSRSRLVRALERNAPGEFVYRLTQNQTSRVGGKGSRIRGGSWWGAVLDGRFPVNFFMANPFVADARMMNNDGFSTYHALELEVRRRFSGGFTFQGNYTYGKALADYDGRSSTLFDGERPSSIRNTRYTVQELMPRHLFHANWIYELPFGPGKRFTAGNDFLQKLLGGWQASGIIRWRSGRPLSIVSEIGTFHRNARSGQNTVNLSQDVSKGDLRDRTGRLDVGDSIYWFDPCLSSDAGVACNDPNAIGGLFQLPNSGELGRLSQSAISGPRSFKFDFSLAKRIQITEATDLEFRWEIFNAFNNVNFNIPETNIFDTDFGRIGETVTSPRLMQFALKINF